MTDIYTTITAKITTLIETTGRLPWQKPWRGGRAGMPKNLLSQKEYRGVNVMMLSCSGYESPYFLTYKQAQEVGGHVNKDERGTTIIKALYREDEATDKSKYIGLKTYTVFNSSQCTLPETLTKLIPTTPSIPEHERIDLAEAIVEKMPDRPTITHCQPEREKVAYYQRGTDTVQIPALSAYDHREFYYAVMFHELGHSTGHTKRLDRATLKDSLRFGDTNYSKEELVAEMTAAFLCGTVGIEETTLTSSAAYIEGWLAKLKSDKTLLVTAAREAQKAADFILGTATPVHTTNS